LIYLIRFYDIKGYQYWCIEDFIIQASGFSADSGLPGIRRTRRHKVQVSFTIKGVTLLETPKPVVSGDHIRYLGDSYWNTRGWTFQERLVSLIFTSEQECEKAAWCEDSSWEHQEAPKFIGIASRSKISDISGTP